ncbi:MAG: hypothetical protein C3F02_04600 [Parcubacteria group bacterium]|nr:MAG: hypothetical protein C3F02_04600 [Parcubacteria group bacterium]
MFIKHKNKKYLIFGSLALVMALFFGIRNIYATEYKLDELDNVEIWQINQDINDKRSQIQDLKKQIEVYQKNIDAKQKELTNLSSQVGTLNDSIAKTNLEIKSVELEVETLNLKIENIQLKIQAKEREISDQKDNIAEILRSLHLEQQKNNLLELLLMNDNFSDFMAELNRLENVQNGLLDKVGELNSVKMALDQDQTDLVSQHSELDTLQDILVTKVENLDGQKTAKNNLMKLTQGQEAKFQALMKQAKEEQEQANNDIVYLEKVAREKLNRTMALDAYAGEGFTWPVASRVITSYFHDKDYPYRWIFEHPAIDIATPQGTPIKAVESGYVTIAKDGGKKGYSYIMIVHASGLSSVYGHINQMSVSVDQFVSKGQIIGYSGGTPGTRGAGPFTTGPHLHLEIRLNGIPVDPLSYLP